MRRASGQLRRRDESAQPEGRATRSRKTGMRDWLLPRGMQFKREDSGEGLEIGVGGKDGPVASDGDGTDQDVRNGDGHSAGAALVADFGGGFVIRSGGGLVGKGTEDGAELLVLACGLDTGQHLLADQADDSGAALLDQVGEFGDSGALGEIAVVRFPAERQGPERGIHKNVHARFLVRSFL
jgi:hypothetical protein